MYMHLFYFEKIQRILFIFRAVKKLHLRCIFLVDEGQTYICVRHRYEVAELLNTLVKNGGFICKFELIDASRTVI